MTSIYIASPLHCGFQCNKALLTNFTEKNSVQINTVTLVSHNQLAVKTRRYDFLQKDSHKDIFFVFYLYKAQLILT